MRPPIRTLLLAALALLPWAAPARAQPGGEHSRRSAVDASADPDAALPGPGPLNAQLRELGVITTARLELPAREPML